MSLPKVLVHLFSYQMVLSHELGGYNPKPAAAVSAVEGLKNWAVLALMMKI